MKIKEVGIENFRSYYGLNPIKFRDGLTLFIGDNGDGKTTFFEALEWLFDTSTQNKNLQLISAKRLAELTIGEVDNVKVSMIFEHDGEKTIEKSFDFSKRDESNVLTSNYQFRGFDGIGTERVPIEGGRLLDRCFDAAIRKYCLFKGETELNVFNKPDAMRYLVETFSNIREFDPYVSFSEYAETNSQKALQNALQSDKKNSQKEKILNADIADLRLKLQNAKSDLTKNRTEATSYTTLLENIEKNKEASTILKDLNDRLNSLNDKLTKTKARIDENYTIKLLDEQWILCGFSTIFDQYRKKIIAASKDKRRLEDEDTKRKGKEEAYKEISSSLANGITPLPLYIPDQDVMEEMIRDEYCKVCGRKAEKGTDAYNFMVSKLTEYLKSIEPKKEVDEKPLFPNNYIKELDGMRSGLHNNQDELKALLSSIKDNIEFNEKRKEEEHKIHNSIEIEEDNKKKLLAQTDNISEEQLLNAYYNISNWWESKAKAEKQIVILEQTVKELSDKLDEKLEDYNSLAQNSEASMYGKVHTALNKIQRAFEYARKKNTNDFLELLETKSNVYLERLNEGDFHGIIRIIKNPDDSARIELYDNQERNISNANTALKTTMYMSVLFAISEITTIKRENDYPLIFDAPTSSFAESKESDFFRVIANIEKQCIIFTKSFLTEDKQNKCNVLNEVQIQTLKGSVHHIEKRRPFDERNLSTIQTTITPIK
ncbi:MAG: AAA family ATPase [Candidatus Symbiothrix sp.]|jgi:DNA sulfur modification protein DndD|nr:AAA family ATPase [Candidatus Symbiothrix sp.]